MNPLLSMSHPKVSIPILLRTQHLTTLASHIRLSSHIRACQVSVWRVVCLVVHEHIICDACLLLLMLGLLSTLAILHLYYILRPKRKSRYLTTESCLILYLIN